MPSYAELRASLRGISTHTTSASSTGASPETATTSTRPSFQSLREQARSEVERPKISQNAGQYQLLNTLTTDEEKYEYLRQNDPDRAESLLNNMEQRANNWVSMRQEELAAAREADLKDPSRNAYRNWAVDARFKEEDQKSVDEAKSQLSAAKKQQDRVSNLRSQHDEAVAAENMKRAAPIYAMLSTLDENEANEYLREIGADTLAEDREELSRVVEQNRTVASRTEQTLNLLTSNLSDEAKIQSVYAYDPALAQKLSVMTPDERKDEYRRQYQYGRMTLDQYEEALAKAEQSFNAYYAEHYDPFDPESEAEYEKLAAEHTWLLENKDNAWKRSNDIKYSGIRKSQDFVSKSQFDNSNRDFEYRYINNVGGIQSEDFPVNRPVEKYKGLTQDEIATYNYIYNTQGKDAAKEYLSYAEYALNARAIQQARQEATDDANENITGASLRAVGSSVVSGVGFLDAAGQKAGQVVSELFGGGISAPVDYNTAAMKPSVFANTVLQVGAQNLNEKYGTIDIDQDEHPLMARIFNGKGWGDVYQMSMSQLNSLVGAGLSAAVPSLGLFTLAGSAATSEMLDTIEKGGTDIQALSMGFMAGFSEYIMEKIPMDNLLHGDWTGNKLASFLIQTGSEGVEELGTGLLNWGADAIIMARNSDYRRNIDTYVAQGMDENAAEQRAFWDKMVELGWDLVGGLALGGLSGSGRAGTQAVIDTANLGTIKRSASLDVYRAITPDLVTRVLAEKPNDKTALDIRAQIPKESNSAENVKPNDIYRLILKNGDTVNQMLSSAAQVINESAAIVEQVESAPASAVQKAVNQVKAGTATGKTFETVLKAAQEDTSVQRALGIDLSAAGNLSTASQKRTAVKSAIERIAAAEQETEAAASSSSSTTTNTQADRTTRIPDGVVQPAAPLQTASSDSATPTIAAASQQAEPLPAVTGNDGAGGLPASYSQATQIAVEAQKKGEKNRVNAFVSQAIKSPAIMAEIGVEKTGNNLKDRTAIKKRVKGLAAMPAIATAEAAQNSPVAVTGTAQQSPDTNQNIPAVEAAPSLESFAQFAEDYRKATPNATDAQIRVAYERKASIAVREGQKVFVNGIEITYKQFREAAIAVAAKRGGSTTEQQIRNVFDMKFKEQRDLQSATDRVNNAFNKAGLGISARISYNPKDFPQVKGLRGNAYFDHGKNEIVFNGNVVTVDDIVGRRLGHEIFHPGAKVDMKLVDATIQAFIELNNAGKLTGEAKRLVTNIDAAIKDRVDAYKKVHGEGFTAEDARVELAADLFGELFHETSLADDIAGVKPNLVSKWHQAIQKIRQRLGFSDDSEDVVATKIRDLESKLVEALKKRGENPDGIKNHSISSMADAAGIQAVRDEISGRITFLDDGLPVDKVTADHIRDRSALGALIKTALENKFISSADAKIQYESAAEIMNMVLNTQDPDMVWQFVGASMLSAVKSNADGQYGTTVDFSTVCRKTQDMITAMSHAMKRLGRGLTKDEVTQLQKKLIEEGTPVPCPVCYVFSRWAGIGAVLDKMALWQDKYANYDKQALADRIAELEKRSKAADLRRALKAEDDEYQKLNSEYEKLSRKLTGLRKQLKAAKGDDAASIKAQIDGATLQRKFIKDQKNDIEGKARGELAWLKTVRTQDGYKAVPKDILYDLENAETFASDEYALSWKYRTTRGPSAGKAILPYADMRVGDMILGVGKNSADGNEAFKEMKGELNDDQRKAVVKAIARTRAQNLIGGQRFQSTSDFRYDYALDYVMAFWEAQALGSNIQTYTKVIEFSDMIAAIGGDVNLSVMPKDKGYKDGKLIFSNVTGINYEAALEANAKYDNAQLILVGINDEHIRLALEDSAETGGETIGFVIPYHASGASIEEFISSLVSNLNEQFVKDNYVDYSDVQGDKARSNATEVQTRRRDLRKQILTGKHKAENDDGKTTSQSWTPTEADFELLVGESVDISNHSFEELRAVEKKALAGDAEAIREYESWSAGVLKDLFNKLWDSNGSQNGVRLNSTQAASIMPHEYWNINTTRANAYVNGFIFRSYCYSMGLYPRFTGMKSKGKKVDHGDFSDSTGYWKTLIDRPMYRNDGTYRDQQAVNMSNFQKGMLTKEWAETHWGEFKVKEPNMSKATQAADKLVDQIRFSLSDQTAPTRDELEAKPPIKIVDIRAPQTKGTFAQRRNAIKRAGEKIYDRPYRNADTGAMIFITERSYTHSYSNLGYLQLNALEHLPEFIENAVLTDVAPPTHGNPYADRVYTFFAAALADYVRPVKLKVKEYRYVGQDLPKNIKAYFENSPQNYASAYDTVVLEVTEIEKSPAGSAKDMDTIDPFLGPEELSEISIAELLSLVKGDAEKYIPKRHSLSSTNSEGGTNTTDNLDIRYSLSASATDSEIAEAVAEKADAAVANAVIDSAPATPESIGSSVMTGEPVGAIIYERDTAAEMVAAIERDPNLMALLEQYGVIPQTGNNYREAELPKRTAPTNRVSKTAVTVMGAEVTPESRLMTIDQAVVDNKLSYSPTTNQRDINEAKRTITRDGFEAAKGDWTAQVRAGKANSKLVAMGATILQNMGGDEFTGEQYVDVLMDYAQLLRNAGQALQAAKILKKLTPEGKLYGIQRQISKYNNEAGLNKTPPPEAWLDGAAEHLARRLSALTGIPIESDKAETEAQKVVRILYDLAKETLPKNIRESGRAKAKERRDQMIMDRIQTLFDHKEEYTRVWNATKEKFTEDMGETPIDFTDFDRMMEDLSHYTTRLLADAKFGGLALDEGLAEAFLGAKTDEGRDAVLEVIYADLGSKIKATGWEKFTAWRYLAMLGNFRTQVRNIAGNLFFQVPRMVSVTTQGALEAMLQKAGVISERTTSALYDKDTFKFAFKDFANVREVILSGGKYQDTSSEDLMQNVEKYRTIFKSKVLEGYRKATNWAMDTGDAAFCSFTYADSLARFMKANGTTWSAASEELREKARLRAIKDAAEATYRDNNSFAEFVSKIGRARDPHNPWEKRAATIIQGVLPFRKTPANILVRANEYSPASLITGAVQAVRKAKGNEDISGTDIVRHFSQGLTGSALVALGIWFASMGNLIGKAPDDDKERELWEMQGYQEYSLVVGNKSYTLDWLAPECIPLFLGANIHQAALEDGLTIGETLKALSSLTDPMLSMSMLQGINDALENATTYGDDAALTRFVGNALWGLLTQNVPTIFGQAERGFERQRMSTYIESGAELPAVQWLVGRLSSKVLGWDYAQILYTDAWGRTQDNPQSKTLNLIYQMFSPGYVSTIKTSPMEEELERLYDATGESKVLISSAGKTITVDGETINLTGDEYYSYSVQRGQTAYAIMTDLVNSPAYLAMDDATRAKAVQKVYDYATQIAKYDITLETYAADKWVLNTRAAAAETGLPETAVVLYKCILSIENEVNTSSTANENVRNAIAADSDLTVAQKNALDALLISDGTFIPQDKAVDYTSNETFIVTQMSPAAQKKWPQIGSQLHISAEQYKAAWAVHHDDNLTAAEKKKKLGEIVNSTQKGNLLYTLLGKKLES